MRANPKSLRQYRRVLGHRIARPRFWRMFLEEQTARLSDEAFIRENGFSGSTESFVDWFHSTVRFRFFFHPRNRKDFFLQLITSTQPYEEILAEAQDVLENRFETLGSGKVDLGQSINWHCDFKSGKEWPVRHLTVDEILDLGNPSDIKVPWELSRFHQVWWLGKAYWLTHREEYAEKFGTLVNDWMEKNPLGKGPNWANAMEAAIRACNLIAGYYFFCESKSLSPQFWLRFLKNLHAHGRFIENNLEVSWRNGNHFLSDVVGLTFLGIFFRHTTFGKRWLRLGVEALEEEMMEQVYADGVNYEKSTAYHRFVLELFSTAAILCQKNSISLSGEFLQRVEKMVEFVQAYTRPDGSTPLIGDADDGRLFRFSMGEEINDHRHALSIGAILFGRHDFKAAAGRFAQDSLWLFGGEGFERHQLLRGDPEPLPSKAFPDGGFYIMRGKNAHVTIDAGDLGMLGRGGHGHNDTFSFEFWANGEPLIIDSGTYVYTADPKARQEFRSTRSHNTVVIDNEEIAPFANLWTVVEDKTNPQVLAWKTSDTEDILEAEHDGYRRLSVVHRRRIEFRKNETALTITDTLTGSGEHLAESFLHFGPNVALEIRNDHLAVARNATGTYTIRASSGTLTILDTRFSRSYGIVEPNKTLRLASTAHLPFVLKWEIRHDVPPQS
jgi:uncharacterized heparinase superfamily protein